MATQASNIQRMSEILVDHQLRGTVEKRHLSTSNQIARPDLVPPVRLARGSLLAAIQSIP